MSVAVDNRGVFGELAFKRAGVFNQARVAPSKPAKVGYSEAKGSFDKAALIVQYHTLWQCTNKSVISETRSTSGMA